MSEPVIDGTYQIKQGPDFAIPKLAGGTGRTDGGVPLTVVSVMNESGSTIAQGTVVKLATLYPVGPGLIVTPTTATTDITLGVALEDIGDQEGGPIALIGAPVLVLTTGTVDDGNMLVPSGTTGLAKAATAGTLTEVAFAISLSEASGTSQVWAILVGLYAQGATTHQHTGVKAAVNFVIGDGTAVIAAGLKGSVRFPYDCTITKWSLVADQSGSIVVDIWKDTYANNPPTVADSIPSPKPTLSSADQNESTSLGSWTTLAVAEGDVMAFNVEATPASVTLVTLTLFVTRTV